MPPMIGPVLASDIDHDFKLAVGRVVEVAGKKGLGAYRKTRDAKTRRRGLLFVFLLFVLFIHQIFSEAYP